MKLLKKTIIILSLIMSLILIVTMINLNILPKKYFILITTSIIVLNIIGLMTLLNKNKYIKILSIISYLIIFVISSVGIIYGRHTINFLKKGFNNNNVEINAYNVVVLKTSDYETIDDLNNKELGYLKNELDKNNYLEEITNKIKINDKEYKSIYELYEDLLNKKIESILLDEAYIDLLEDDYKDINEKIKIIYSYDIKKEIEKKQTESELKPINIYISGSDSRSGYIETKTRTDVNMIMTINPKTRTILLTSIPRDYYVQLHNTTGYKDKLTHSGIYGIEMSKTTIEDLFNIKIDYTIKVGFQSVIKIVDLIDGIDIDSDQTFITHCGDGGAVKTQVIKGMNHFNGPQALSYARERYAYMAGDNHRILNQQQVLEAIITKALKDKNIIYKYNDFLESFRELYRTDIPEDIIKKYIKNQLDDNKTWKIEKQVVTGTGTMDITYSMPGRNLYVMIPNMESVNKATEKINEIKKNN